MRKHIDSSKALLVVLLATGLSAACMNNPVAGTSEPDASPDTTAPIPDTAPASTDSLPVKLDTAVAVCGNGKLDPGESCDDGNAIASDGCAASCTVEPGAVCPEPGMPCSISPYCGDGQVQFQFGEQCDLGASNNGSYGGCNPDCTIGPTCGDGIVQADHETCDDGNILNDDGCSDTCQVEPCWAACGCNSSKPCLPVMMCGNGKLEGGEACDDGNTMPGDGCSGTCQIEPGWTCVAPGGRCSSVCGDGILTAGESCDDGNALSGDGCSSDCKLEPNY